jgi:hypothetical protein
MASRRTKPDSEEKTGLPVANTGGAKSQALTAWRQQLAEQAKIAAKMEEHVGGGKTFSVRNGVLVYNDTPIEGNQIPVVIAAHVLENVYYGDAPYDPDNPASPICFAFGESDKDMAPHPNVVAAGQAQSESTCQVCPMNQWGSNPVTARGKACKNTRRLALVAAGAFDARGVFKRFSAKELMEGEIAYMRLPVTSTAAFAQFVKSAAGALKLPPHGLITKISVKPDPKTQFRVVFEPIEALTDLDDDYIAAAMTRHDEAKQSIASPYQLGDPNAARGSTQQRAAARAKPSARVGASKFTRASN